MCLPTNLLVGGPDCEPHRELAAQLRVDQKRLAAGVDGLQNGGVHLPCHILSQCTAKSSDLACLRLELVAIVGADHLQRIGFQAGMCNLQATQQISSCSI